MSHDADIDGLAARAQSGDQNAFEQLVRRLVRPALAAAWELVATHEDAEDVVQDAFARTWRRLDSYDATRPFAPWFFTILRNVARNAARADRRWHVTSLSGDVLDDASMVVVEGLVEAPDAVFAALDVERIHTALEELPPMQRACFRLTVIEGFASAEVGAMLGISDATVRVHASRGRKALRARLGIERGMDS